MKHRKQRPRQVTGEMIKAAHATEIERLRLERLRDQVRRLLATLEEATQSEAVPAPGVWVPPIDICETEQAVVVHVELPGVCAKQTQVLVSNTQLRICGEKRQEAPRQRVVSHLRSERSYGHFSRVVRLRWTVNVPETTAELADGVLTVRLPKRRERRGTEFRVEIKESEGVEGRRKE